MPYISKDGNENTFDPIHGHRNPETTSAYLIGGGIASLAAAVHLIHDAHVPASQIHILESSAVDGGAMDGAGDPEKGYIMRGGRMLNFSYRCLYDLLSIVPSLSDPKKTVMTEINEFNGIPTNKTHANSRLIAQAAQGPEVIDVTRFGLNTKDKWDLLKTMLEPEKSLGTKSIEECFDQTFFGSNFWLMWATTFAFQPWHSVVEFRRYLHRFIQEFPRINTLAGVDRTPYNQYDSIILPITKYLEAQGVDFRYGTKALSLSYAEGGSTTVERIHITENGFTGIINVHSNDLVIATLGSMTADSSIGTNTSAPALSAPPLRAPDGAWAFWDSISKDNPHFGNPSHFYTQVPSSNWESFTMTLSDPELFSRLTEWSHNTPGTGALITLKDSNWLMSIVVPHQPHFITQPPHIQVLWGYGLNTNQPGNQVKKPMSACTGQEIMTELLHHLDFPLQPILENSITIPCMMPYITSQFLTREYTDRPKVFPEGTTNLAFVGQFVEIPEDVVFTVEYSVRGAQMAVFKLMGLKKRAKKVYKGEYDVGVLTQAMKTLLFSGGGGEAKDLSGSADEPRKDLTSEAERAHDVQEIQWL